MAHFLDADPIAEEILKLLRRFPGEGRSPQRLSTDLQLEPPRIAAAVAALRGVGYKIIENSTGYILSKTSARLTPVEIESGLKTRVLGRRILCFEWLDSTNARAFREAEKGAKEGTMIIAECQVGGRGRLGRRWHSAPGLGLWLSVILRPDISPAAAPGLSLIAGLSLAETIESELQIPVELKWPNDCQIGGRKVAGILTELATTGPEVRFVVLGVGINILHQPGDFPPELRRTATSLTRATKKPVDRVSFLQEFLSFLERNYVEYREKKMSAFIEPYTRRCRLIGCRVRAQMENRIITGRAVGIDSSGGLIVDQDGTEIVLTAGEVTRVR